MYNKRFIVVNIFLILMGVFSFSSLSLAESKITSRVINGKPALINDFPWMVYLFINDKDGGGGRECGGTLIDKEWVLTAAHCFLNSDEDKIDSSLGGYVSVLLNSNTLMSVDNGAKIIQSSSVIIHPNFDPFTLDFDIALLKLSQPVVEQPIALLLTDSLSLPTVNSKVTILGWGATKVSASNKAIGFSNTLLKADQLIVSSKFCENAYKGSGLITNNMICANGITLTDTTDTCIGDSGGPLVIKQNDHFIQVGVTSFGGSDVICGEPRIPGVYTRLSTFIDYITQHIPSVQVRTLDVKKAPPTCAKASMDAELNINMSCIIVDNKAYGAVLDKTSKQGYSWSWAGKLTNSSCIQSLQTCSTVNADLGLMVKTDSGMTGILKFDGNVEQGQYIWRLGRAYTE